MSTKKFIVEISQPQVFRANNTGEVLKFPAQRCETCNGEGGWFIGEKSFNYDPETGEYYKKCGTCKGTGELEAQVVVGWRPHGNIKPQYLEATSG